MIEKLQVPLSENIHFIDTPGFGVADEMESFLGGRLGKTTAAYVYTMSYLSVTDDMHMCAIKLLHERDQSKLF